MKKTIILFVFTWLIFYLGPLNAQDQDLVKITLSSGKTYKGKLLSIDSLGEKVYIETKKQLSLGLPQELIEDMKVMTSFDERRPGLTRLKNHLDIGGEINYNTNTVGPQNGRLNGISVQLRMAYSLNQHWSLGLLTGMDSYNADYSEYLIPILFSTTYYIRPYEMSPFLRINAGYSLGVQYQDSHLLDHKGGMTLRPGLGLRLPSWQGLSAELGLGMQWQQNEFATVKGNQISRFDLTYKRLVMSLGLNF
ncbi:hypothetical protein [Membranihabitans marinus]|uniref:hypothetical protein n=1 Tax=Membranihabitans marinus TaxID=1227546 RepID=UPI001F31CF89|nr:hypothetical protein [Membranihabitans marinus]